MRIVARNTLLTLDLPHRRTPSHTHGPTHGPTHTHGPAPCETRDYRHCTQCSVAPLCCTVFDRNALFDICSTDCGSEVLSSFRLPGTRNKGALCWWCAGVVLVLTLFCNKLVSQDSHILLFFLVETSVPEIKFLPISILYQRFLGHEISEPSLRSTNILYSDMKYTCIVNIV